MKNTFILLMCILCTSASAQIVYQESDHASTDPVVDQQEVKESIPDPYVVFSGHVENSPTRYIDISYHEDLLSRKKFNKQSVLDTKNEFQFQFPLTEPRFVLVKLGGQRFETYIMPGDSLDIQMDANEGPDDIQFTGSAANSSMLCRAMSRTLGDSEASRIILRGFLEFHSHDDTRMQATEMGTEDYVHLRETEKKKWISELNGLCAEYGISPELKEKWEREIQYKSLRDELYFLNQNRFSNDPGLPAYMTQLDQKLSQTTISDESMLDRPVYLQFLNYYIDYQLYKEGDRENAYEEEYYRLAELHLDSKVKYHLQSTLFLHSLQQRDRNLAEKKFVTFKQSNPYSEQIVVIENNFGSQLRFLEGAGAYNFTVVSEEDFLVSLSDYRGKVVYLKFWASWCRPCIEDFEKERALRAKLEERGVVLLNLSIDKSERLWRDALEKYDIPGSHFIAQDVADLKENYNFDALPVSFVIDQNGGFARLSSAPDKMIQEIDALLAE